MNKESSLTILAVDDESENNDFIRRALRSRHQYKVITAASGKDALELLRTQHVDVILADQSMPNMTGVQFLEQTKAVVPDAIRIMVTGFPEMKEVLQALRRGLVLQVVVKPVGFKDIVGAIEHGLTLRRMKSAVRNLSEEGK